MNQYKLNYIRTGPRGGTPIIFVHAVGMDLTLWEKQIGALHKDYDVIAFDMPGHGLSPAIEGELTFSKFADSLIQLIEELASGPVHLAGISFGGMVVQTMAIARPDLVKSLTLIGTACTFPEPVRNALKERAQFIVKEGIHAVAPLSLARWFTPEFSETRPDIIDLVKKTLYKQQAAYHAAIWDIISALDTQQQLTTLHVPALIIVGSKDTSTPVASAQLLADALKVSNIHIVDNAAHLTNLEAADNVSNLIMQFLATL